jgi:hypothetical protein
MHTLAEVTSRQIRFEAAFAGASPFVGPAAGEAEGLPDSFLFSSVAIRQYLLDFLDLRRSHGFSTTTTSSGVGFSSLAPHGEISPVSHAPIRTNFRKPPNVSLNFSAKISFDFIVAGNFSVDLGHIHLG